VPAPNLKDLQYLPFVWKFLSIQILDASTMRKKLIALIANDRLEWNWLALTNAPALYMDILFTTIKSFIAQVHCFKSPFLV
jgi:hypothetical protein